MSSDKKKEMIACPHCKRQDGRCARHPNGDSAPSDPRASPFAWASIAGANPEPVEISEVDGRPCVYTTGCGDPFFMDDPSVVLYVDDLERPDNLLTQEQVDERERQWRLDASRPSHRWRGPR